MTEGNELENSGFKIRYLFYFVLVLLAILSIASYSPQDGAVVAGGVEEMPGNWIGNIGATFGYWMFNLFGLSAYFLVALTVLRMVRLILPGKSRPLLFLTGELMTTGGVMLLLALAPQVFVGMTDYLGIGRLGAPELALSGGAIGQILAAPAAPDFHLHEGILRQLIGGVGTTILGWALVIGGILVIYFSDWHRILRSMFGAIPLEDAQDALLRRIDALAASAAPDKTNAEPDEETIPEENDEDAVHTAAGKKSLWSTLTSKIRKPPPENANEPEPSRHDDVPWKEESEPENGHTAATPENVPSAAAEPMPTEKTPPEVSPAESSRANPVFPSAGTMPKELPTVGISVTEHGEKGKIGIFHKEYELPSVFMLSKGKEAQGEDRESIIRSRDILQQTLDSFKVPGSVSGYISGPRVTRYEISLEPGVKVSKVEDLADNIAMNLSAKSVRVLAPIPGRPVVGVETPNSKPEAVFMRSIMESEQWQNGKAEIPIVLGKDVAGNPVILDLAKAPHLLIAGSTGSGKSVCMNTLITSLIFRFNPDQLKLIMVDPKIVEFEDYKHLPHLITPVINDYRKVPIALRWAVNEMEKRYLILARAGVKKLSEFNKRIMPEKPVFDDDGMPLPEKMPALIVIIDELADLMMTDAKKDAETSITRIAQKGRAAGVHIVVATQRPSTNVITGIIKANLPTRIAFRVGQMIDSRVILDQNGAEKLLGMGDMLYMSPGGSDVERVQGAWVMDDDIKKVVEFVSGQVPQKFNDQVVAEEQEAEDGEDDDGDFKRSSDDDGDDDFSSPDLAPLLKKYLKSGDDENVRRALEVVLVDHKVSTSYLQRRLRIGYNRAAEIIDLFEERGIVGPASGSGNKREILIFDEIEG